MPVFSHPNDSDTASRSDRAKARLLAAALEVFGEKNLEGATVREIADKAGQNIAAISYHFGGKEALYHAVIEAILEEMKERLGSVFEELRGSVLKADLTQAEALSLLKRFIRAVYLRGLSREDTLAIGRLLMREQMKPTPAFEILFEKGFRVLHESLCMLVGRTIGTNAEDPLTILRAQTLLGQLYGFCIARETLRRRLNWETLEGHNAEIVADVLEENIEVLLLGLKARESRRKKTALEQTRKS